MRQKIPADELAEWFEMIRSVRYAINIHALILCML